MEFQVIPGLSALKGKNMTEENLTPTPKKTPKVKLKPMVNPAISKDPSSLISTYRKRQQVGPFIIWGLVVVLLVVGIILLVVSMANGNGPKISWFATATPTPTMTFTPTSSPTVTATASETSTPTETLTPTPDAPFDYTVQENDNLFGIAEKFNLGDQGVAKLLALNPEIDPTTGNMSIGQKIKIPNPGYQLPTATPLPTGMAYGTKVTYVIQPGDTLAGIASLFNSTIEDIMTQNKITDANSISVGQKIVVRVNLVTPTPKPKPTITPGPSPTSPSPYTPTPG